MERDTLFSYHQASEAFLQRMMSLYVASHYKNTPNDLLLMADAPAHQLFALLGPIDEAANRLPDVVAVVQVALEGAISKKSALAALAAGHLPQGDLIPWQIGSQFQDSEFPALSGARIVRIAVHPDLTRGGYGSRAVELLGKYYQGEFASLHEDATRQSKAKTKTKTRPTSTSHEDTLRTETLTPRSGLPPLLVALSDRPAEPLQYLGTSFGLTLPLYGFWRKAGFSPVYLRQTAHETTGEHSMIMLKALASKAVEGTAWVEPFVRDFRTRFMSLLSGPFRSFSPATALTILDPKITYSDQVSISYNKRPRTFI